MNLRLLTWRRLPAAPATMAVRLACWLPSAALVVVLSMASLHAVQSVAVARLASSQLLPATRVARTFRRARAPAHVMSASPQDDDEPDELDQPASGLLSPKDMELLQQRVRELEAGSTGAAEELYRMITKDEPPDVILRFIRNSSPLVVEAMQSAVMSLLGSLPPQFSQQYSTTLEKFTALIYQLQMTGYLFRNAEYVLQFKQVLKIKHNTEAELRKAFDTADKDGSGDIDAGEARVLLEQIDHRRQEERSRSAAEVVALVRT